MSEVEDYVVRFRVLKEDVPEYDEYIQHELDRLEKEVIYKAVKQVKDSWICIKPEISKERVWCSYAEEVEYHIRVYCQEVQQRRVYVPIYSEQQMPRDVFECKFCGGMTKNDRRGHCGSCGAPRNNKYLDKHLD